MVKTVSKTDLTKQIAKDLGVTPAEVKRMEAAQQKAIERNVKAGKAVKVLDVKVFPHHKKAVKGGQKKMGPQGEYITKAKPARTVVKARPLGFWKNLKL